MARVEFFRALGTFVSFQTYVLPDVSVKIGSTYVRFRAVRAFVRSFVSMNHFLTPLMIGISVVISTTSDTTSTKLYLRNSHQSIPILYQYPEFSSQPIPILYLYLNPETIPIPILYLQKCCLYLYHTYTKH